jgi:hypothetical protein
VQDSEDFGNRHGRCVVLRLVVPRKLIVVTFAVMIVGRATIEHVSKNGHGRHVDVDVRCVVSLSGLVSFLALAGNFFKSVEVQDFWRREAFIIELTLLWCLGLVLVLARCQHLFLCWWHRLPVSGPTV